MMKMVTEVEIEHAGLSHYSDLLTGTFFTKDDRLYRKCCNIHAWEDDIEMVMSMHNGHLDT